jgi:hypothetical protein
MHPFPIGKNSRIALLGGVSLIALQGLSACTHSKPAMEPGVSTAITVPVAPLDGYGKTVAQPYTPPENGTLTTLAIGEEDGSGPIPVEPDGGIGDGAGPPPIATTLAIGEEDGEYIFPTDPDDATTLALGEEDNVYLPDQPGVVTTLAIGEEDGSGPIPVEPDGGIGDGAGPPSFVTTFAIGEEDGGGYGNAF